MPLSYEEGPAQAGVYIAGPATGPPIEERLRAVRERANAFYNFEEYVDADVPISGRPALETLLTDIGLLDVIVCWSLMDLGPTWTDFEVLLSRLPNRALRVIAVRENLDFELPTGPLAQRLMSATQAFQTAERSSRARTGAERARADGRRLGRPPKPLPRHGVIGTKSMTIAKAAETLGTSVTTTWRWRKRLESLDRRRQTD